jgi:hypothetical protein
MTPIFIWAYELHEWARMEEFNRKAPVIAAKFVSFALFVGKIPMGANRSNELERPRRQPLLHSFSFV